MTRFRVASTKLEEIHSGASFAPGEEAVGFDPNHPEDARKLDEGLIVEIQEEIVRPPSEAVVKKAEELGVDLDDVTPTGKTGITVADVQRTHDNQEESK
jgi:hypothetical protein